MVSHWAFGLDREPPLTRLDLYHATGNQSSCRVAEKSGFALASVQPALSPTRPYERHLHSLRRPAPGGTGSPTAR
ncbi:GNAT family N-acetyltransferase [Streptacidiphilus sp. 4-A2]|nr:GNAT family N-acetyltransferase [Streptacidiphilus sp. 4-A2]